MSEPHDMLNERCAEMQRALTRAHNSALWGEHRTATQIATDERNDRRWRARENLQRDLQIEDAEFCGGLTPEERAYQPRRPDNESGECEWD